jgi:sulfite exporter TauE/SafE
MMELSQASYLSAFLVGLLGGVHCLGMCGGIVTALTFNVSTQPKNNPQAKKPAHFFFILLGYNFGRILGYTLAGGLVGGVGAGILSLTDIQTSRLVMSIIAGVFMIALGLYLAGLWQGISHLERAGQHLWKHIEPFSRAFIPATTVSKAIPLGLLWGWLPCGLVYTILIWTLSAGSMIEGALLMMAFGIGTLPNLLAISLISKSLIRWTQKIWIRRLAGMMVVGLGLLMLLI